MISPPELTLPRVFKLPILAVKLPLRRSKSLTQIDSTPVETINFQDNQITWQISYRNLLRGKEAFKLSISINPGTRMRVENYMSQMPITIRDDTDYWKAFEIMQEKDLHHIPVVDENSAVVGILTRRDLKIASMHFKEATVEVAEVMHSPVVTTTPGELLAEAAKRMIDHRIGGLPVVDANGQIAGILTETDLLRALIDQLDKETA